MSTTIKTKPSLVMTMEDVLNNAGTVSTENGAPTHNTSGNKIVDLYDAMGGLRHDPLSILPIFDAACDEDPLAATKCAFLLRNPRGGMGERTLFDVIISHLSKSKDRVKNLAVLQNIHLMPKYGRWDDLLTVVCSDVPMLADAATAIIKTQLNEDIHNLANNKISSISLLAKWLPSDNASSKTTKALARKLSVKLDMRFSYRKTLVALRKALNDAVVETKMSARNFENIDYSKVCSKASLIYRNSFLKRDNSRYNKWVEDVASGASKVNASVLHPHEITSKAMRIQDSSIANAEVQFMQNIWDALPDFGMTGSALPVLDVSPCMTFETISKDSKITPLEACLGLGTYLSQNCSGKFKNHFMTFSDHPEIQEIQGTNIVETSQWLADHPGMGYSTNLQSIFDCILEAVVEASDLPDYIYILTDGEFDAPGQHVSNGFVSDTNHDVIQKKFEDRGLAMPKLVYWNLQRRLDQAGERKNNIAMKENDFGLIASGFSPAMIAPIMRCEIISPRAIVEEALKPYDDVELDDSPDFSS